MSDNYSLKLKELYKELKSSEEGLNNSEAKERLEKYGFNEIARKERTGPLSIFFSQFKSPLVLILVLASIIAGFLNEIINSVVILGIVFLDALLGFYQEFKSEKALSELKKYIKFTAEVLRNNKKIELDVKNLVPGDIVFLEIGDIVPADIRLIDSENLTVNEAVISGESFPVNKTHQDISLQKSKSKEENIVFMGTSILNGFAKGIIISTGKNTQFGKTALFLSAKEPPTDFQKNIKNFGNFLLKVIFSLTILVFALNTLLGKDILDSFLFALAIAVGITPELLPIIITISLSAGALHLVRKKVVIKKLVSIEDLGNIDVLCIDKTGTLTENNITLQNYFDIGEKKQKEIIEFSLVCSSIKNNVIDTAISNYAKKENISTADYKKIKEIEFDYKRRRASVVAKKGQKTLLISKGAPESIFEICKFVKKQNKIVPIKDYLQELKEKFEFLSNQGIRVISTAYKETAKKNSSTEDENNMIFSGFLTFLDPPKKEVRESLAKFQKLEIDLKILTGDNELITKKICNDIGLQIKGKIILGSELENMSETKLQEAITNNNIFATVNPEQKLRIVNKLSEKGHIVGFLGDGINDSPALKAADVGITVDSAVDIARDSADIVLLKKSLNVISDGIKQGRRTFGNITKYILNTISANFGNMFTLATSSLFLKFIPLLPSQILLANFISDVPMVTISTDNVDESYLHKPKRWNIKSIRYFMIYFGLISSLFDFITIGILYFIVKADTSTFRTAWFLESVLSEMIITFAIRTKKNFWQSKPSKLLVYSSLLAIILTIGLIYSPIAFLFEFEKITIPILAAIGTILLVYLLIGESFKKRFYKKQFD